MAESGRSRDVYDTLVDEGVRLNIDNVVGVVVLDTDLQGGMGVVLDTNLAGGYNGRA